MCKYSAKEIIANFTPKAIKCDSNGNVLIRDQFSGMDFWFDVYTKNGEVIYEWNQYIFLDNNVEDMLREEIQNDCRVSESAFNCAYEYVCNNSEFPNFICDHEKMVDFKVMSKERFLQSYSYITEEEYNNTKTICYGA